MRKHNGFAKDLWAAVDFYDQRFHLGRGGRGRAPTSASWRPRQVGAGRFVAAAEVEHNVGELGPLIAAAAEVGKLALVSGSTAEVSEPAPALAAALAAAAEVDELAPVEPLRTPNPAMFSLGCASYPARVVPPIIPADPCDGAFSPARTVSGTLWRAVS